MPAARRRAAKAQSMTMRERMERMTAIAAALQDSLE
jgi:hypothetical protein